MWNVISYVRTDKVTSITDFDSRKFIDDVFTRGTGGTVLQCSVDSRAVTDGYITGDEAATVPCIDRSWQLTSVQAGFEIWEGGTYTNFTSSNFSVDPIVVSGPITGTKTLPDGTPVVHWAEKFKVETNGCTNGAPAGFQITALESGISTSGTLTETPTGSGYYISGDVGPLEALGMHGPATVKVSMTCNGTPVERTASIFIDPSGVVVNTLGKPIEGAQVTLSRSSSGTATGPFADVVNGDSTVMDPAVNVNNPTTTNQYGWYRWDVIPGWYKVRAAKAGCTSAETQAVQVVSPPGVTDLNLVLNCGETPPSAVTVVMTPMSDWQTGYCRNVIVTNNGSAPVDWKVTFTLTDGGTINNFWNVIWSQSGNQVTAEGVSWNNILQPGQSSHSLGFCAAK
jgi:hypothetical protein